MKKAVMIYNPNSGLDDLFKKKDRLDTKKCISIFEKYGYEVEIYRTKYPGHAKEIVSTLPSNVDFVVSVGGDGTFNETMTGNFLRKKRIVVSHSADMKLHYPAFFRIFFRKKFDHICAVFIKLLFCKVFLISALCKDLFDFILARLNVGYIRK